ncbi:MAG: OmpA/MotB domain-containing protein [Parcubacteria group bacterium Gr01-1014_20]|nr:MAG: OmpA/MotB domain-containing protein [Parcubacteria group bacterium Gr01-1014_20]
MSFWKNLTGFSRFLIIAVVVGGLFFAAVQLDFISLPKAKIKQAIVPQKANLPQGQDPSAPSASNIPERPLPSIEPAYLSTPPFTTLIWAWNSQMGGALANGGLAPTKGSIMAERSVNLNYRREDNADKMKLELLNFAQAVKDGNPYPDPATTCAFVSIMGDGAPAFIAGVNKSLIKLGPEYTAVIVGSHGYSRGEDKFMGPEEWKRIAQKARGGVVAGYLTDGDWNIAIKWCGDNGIPNNPDVTTYDPTALNWVAADDYKHAALLYVQGYSETRPIVIAGKKTGRDTTITVQGVVTWTPGDVIVARQRGGIVSIVSTKEYSYQMPNTIVGIKRWCSENKEIVANMLAGIFEGGDQVKTYPRALRKAAEISDILYNEAETGPAYWERYFHGVTETDIQGLRVELGGSKVNNLADNLHLFGLAGGPNIYAATYKVFGDIVVQQYPNLVPSYPPISEVFDPQYILAAQRLVKTVGKAEVPSFAGTTTSLKQMVSSRDYTINFRSGSAEFMADAYPILEAINNSAVVAGDLQLVIHGHTDSVGTDETNLLLSDKRARAVKSWLESRGSTTFPQGRIQIVPHGELDPINHANTSAALAENRRVQIVMGTPQR